jgi:hypothetical protein
MEKSQGAKQDESMVQQQYTPKESPKPSLNLEQRERPDRHTSLSQIDQVSVKKEIQEIMKSQGANQGESMVQQQYTPKVSPKPSLNLEQSERPDRHTSLSQIDQISVKKEIQEIMESSLCAIQILKPWREARYLCSTRA